MKLNRSVFVAALSLGVLASTQLFTTLTFANPSEAPTAPLLTAAESESYVKVVFLNGLQHSWWAPGVKKASEEFCEGMKEQCTKDGQGCATWTWGQIKDVPKDLYDAGVSAVEHFEKTVTRPKEIVCKECSESYNETIKTAYEDAQGQSDPLQRRLTILSGKTRACLKVAAKTTIQAPVVGFYHAISGLLVVPAQGVWNAFKITMGACGTAIYNVGNPIVRGLRLGQASACSGIAAVGVGIANEVLPDVPVPPTVASNPTVSHDERAPTVSEMLTGGEEH